MSIENIKYKSNNTHHSSCSICLEEFEDNETISKTSCNHMFHETCLETWLNTNTKCPFCRNTLKEESNNLINIRNLEDRIDLFINQIQLNNTDYMNIRLLTESFLNDNIINNTILDNQNFDIYFNNTLNNIINTDTIIL